MLERSQSALRIVPDYTLPPKPYTLHLNPNTLVLMKIEGSHQLTATRERVYQCLIDPEVLQRCIPGCERLEKTGENIYAATIRAGVGSIKEIFNGSVRLEDMRPPEHYRIVVDGKAGRVF